MYYLVFAAVLLAALLDALQHVLIKGGTDPFARSLNVALAGGALALPLLIFTGLPQPAALPWLALSVCLGTAYWIALGRAYQSGALALVFPLSRGGGVLLSATGSHLWMSERLSIGEALVLALILTGLMVVAIGLSPRQGITPRAVLPSVVLGAIIGAFTLVDAVGVRAGGGALPYCLALYVGNACCVALFCLIRQGPRLAQDLDPGVFLSASLSMAAYALILFGFRHGPVATVAALAETSIVFAAVFGRVFLAEPTRPSQAFGLFMVMGGVTMLRLGLPGST